MNRSRKLVPSRPLTMTGARDSAFAAIALSEHLPEKPSRTIRHLVKNWWRGKRAPALQDGSRTLAHAETYPLLELLHVVRDNLQIELRDNAPGFFRDLPAFRLLSYYPATYPAAENEYRIPYFHSRGEPDLRVAALTRAAELSMVAYDTNAVESQFVQGWLLHDTFQLRGAFGAPYEFLWANPYQPGLSYHHMPLQFHDTRNGQIFLRSNWNEDATWLGYDGGKVQLFREGRVQIAPLPANGQPLIVGESAVVGGQSSMKWALAPDDPPNWFVVGLKPSRAYEIEVDDEEMTEVVADKGGILPLKFERRNQVGVRLRERVTTRHTRAGESNVSGR